MVEIFMIKGVGALTDGGWGEDGAYRGGTMLLFCGMVITFFLDMVAHMITRRTFENNVPDEKPEADFQEPPPPVAAKRPPPRISRPAAGPVFESKDHAFDHAYDNSRAQQQQQRGDNRGANRRDGPQPRRRVHDRHASREPKDHHHDNQQQYRDEWNYAARSVQAQTGPSLPRHAANGVFVPETRMHGLMRVANAAPWMIDSFRKPSMGRVNNGFDDPEAGMEAILRAERAARAARVHAYESQGVGKHASAHSHMVNIAVREREIQEEEEAAEEAEYVRILLDSVLSCSLCMMSAKMFQSLRVQTVEQMLATCAPVIQSEMMCVCENASCRISW